MLCRGREKLCPSILGIVIPYPPVLAWFCESIGKVSPIERIGKPVHIVAAYTLAFFKPFIKFILYGDDRDWCVLFSLAMMGYTWAIG
jgi:hypothetical protein